MINQDPIIPPNCIYLNIQELKEEWINCCFFVIDESDLRGIDNIEVGYKRIEVQEAIREFDTEGGPVYAYQALPNYLKEPITDQPEFNASPMAYLVFLNTTFENLRRQYKTEFSESTIKYDESVLLWVCFGYSISHTNMME